MSDLPDSPLERTVDDLYDGSSDDFVARRAALAATLTRDGYRAEAAALRKLRRPTVAADAVNRVARAHPDDVHKLTAAGDRLRQAQEDAVAGRGAADLRAAQKSRNEIVERLTDLALAALADTSPQPETYRSALASTFEAASIDPDARASVESGTLVKELASASRGLGAAGRDDAVVSLGAARGSSPRRARGTAAEPDADARADSERVRAAIADARRIEREAQRVADRDEAAAMRARALADEAARVVEELEEQVAAARRSEREARAAARAADRVARDSARAAGRAADRARSLDHANDEH